MKINLMLVVSFVLLSTSLIAKESNSTVVSRSSQVEGKALNEYANIWWQWAKSMSKNNSAVIDKTGTKCGTNQEGEVWFLAGGYGASKIKRKCTIPKNKYIFFPIINTAYWPKGESKVSCKAVKAGAALNNDKLLSLEVILDGKEISSYRLKSKKCFDLLGRIPKEYKAPKVYPSASDGYWVMLNPLTEGIHELKFKAQYNNKSSAYGRMFQDIEYQLNIK